MSLLVPDFVKLAREEGREEGREKGREEGLAQGETRGLQEALLRVVRRRLGDCSADIETRVRAITETASLELLLDRAAAAETLAEFRAALPDA